MKISDENEFEKANIFKKGQPNDAYAKYFVGNSFLNPLTDFGKDPLFLANVTFEPGCRNNWHIHQSSSGGGQLLICTAGEGWYQEWQKPKRKLQAGDVVVIPPNVKHWHGAANDSWFSHISVEIPGQGTGTKWLEEVDDEYLN